jgi:hypothetical protein
MTADGLCAAHGGLTDMRAIGAAGGRGSVRSRLGPSDDVADEGLREKARRRLEKVLDGDDEAAALRAAQSLYSYRAAEPRPTTSGARVKAASTWLQAAKSLAWPTSWSFASRTA